jgi:hypothetical protein
MPAVLENFPAGQFVQLDPYCPSAQLLTHAALELAPVVAVAFPVEHAGQPVAQLVLLYVLIAQGLQVLVATAFWNWPGEQHVQSDAPASAYLPAAQLVHCRLLVAATAVEAVPAGQFVHTLIPSDIANFPAVHDGHEVEPAELAVP